jgi:hypothetical protein
MNGWLATTRNVYDLTMCTLVNPSIKCFTMGSCFKFCPLGIRAHAGLEHSMLAFGNRT